MDQNTNQILIALLRSAIRGNSLSSQEVSLITPQRLPRLIEMAKKHDLLHLLALALKQSALLQEAGKSGVENEIIKAVYRYEQSNYELAELCGALEEAKIHFLPLKGSVLRQYYPQPWMRTSCDIDVLVAQKDLGAAADCLQKKHGYTYAGKGPHDVSLFSSGGMHLELHYDLIENGIAKASSKVLEAVWGATTVRDGCVYWREMADEMFYFYHIAHMAKHLEEGGCGIRTFIDLWILDHREGFDKAKRDELLKKGNLLKFAKVARALSRVWLEGAEHTEITMQMEQYILQGGMYGTGENRIAIQQQKKGGRLKYAFSKIFIPYDVIKFHYPILQKHRWLTPIMEVRRWFKLLFCGRARSTIRELKYNSNISHAEAEAVQAFLTNIGL